MFAFSFVMLIIPLTAIWIERATGSKIPYTANIVLGLMLISGYVSLVTSLALVIWKYLP